MSTTLHPALDAVRECLAQARIPDEPFDPDGTWTNRYGIWVMRSSPSTEAERRGTLIVRREINGADRIRLDIDLDVELYGKGTEAYQHTCRMQCRADALATPVTWKLHVRTRSSKSGWEPLSEFTEEGEIAAGLARWRGARERTRAIARPVTSSWSLFDAVQRNFRAGDRPLDFDLLDETDLFKADHRLERGSDAKVELGGKTMTLHCFDQVGSGCLPLTYWLNDQGRMLMLIGGMRAYIMDAMAQART